MNKLFGKPVESVALESTQEGCLPEEDIGSTLVDEDMGLQMASEATEMALERLKSLEGMQAHLGAQKLCSTAYLHAMESYSPVVRSIGYRLGVKHFPSLEDFGNPHAAKDAHTFAMEGFRDMISKAWEKIKAFFRDFFKKISLFVKRLVRANLDLESYERYCEQLVGKLNANKAVISDSSPLVSALPVLLADKGQTAMDSDFVLIQGSRKIKNLLTMVNEVSMQGRGGKLYALLSEYRSDLKAFIDINKDGVVSEQNFDDGVGTLRAHGFVMLSMLFQHELTDPRHLPTKAFQSLLEHYEGKQLKTDTIKVMSVADPYDPYLDLPRGVNLYLTHVGGDNFFICSSKEQGDSASKTLVPIGTVNNLVEFHKTYKNTLGKFNLKTMDKNVDGVAAEVDKILSMLQKDFSAVVDNYRELRVSYTPEFLAELFKQVTLRGKRNADDLSEALNLVEAAHKNNTNPDDGTFNSLINDLFLKCDPPTNNTDSEVKDLKGHVGSVHQARLKTFIDAYMSLNKASLGELPVVEGEVSKSKKLRDLNQFLVSLFTRLQTLYKSIATDFYAVLTELRYAVIKYIYDSAKRYSY